MAACAGTGHLFCVIAAHDGRPVLRLEESAGDSWRPGRCRSGMGTPIPRSIQVEGSFLCWMFSVRSSGVHRTETQYLQRKCWSFVKRQHVVTLLPLCCRFYSSIRVEWQQSRQRDATSEASSCDDGSACADANGPRCSHLSCRS